MGKTRTSRAAPLSADSNDCEANSLNMFSNSASSEVSSVALVAAHGAVTVASQCRSPSIHSPRPPCPSPPDRHPSSPSASADPLPMLASSLLPLSGGWKVVTPPRTLRSPSSSCLARSPLPWQYVLDTLCISALRRHQKSRSYCAMRRTAGFADMSAASSLFAWWSTLLSIFGSIASFGPPSQR